MRNVILLLLLAYLIFTGCSRKTRVAQTEYKAVRDTSVKQAPDIAKLSILNLTDSNQNITKLSDSLAEALFSPPKVSIDYNKASALQCYHNAIFHPARYMQICSYQPFEPYKKEFIPFYIRTGEFWISEKQYKAIRAKRDSVIAITKNDTNEFSEYSLDIMIDLNAVELLPALIAKAGKLNETYYNCIENGKDWSPIHLTGDTTKDKTDWQCYNTTDTLSNILSTITGILKQEAYAPMLNSEIIKGGKPVPMKKKNVDMILGWAQDYLKNTPESMKKEAYKRMMPKD